MKFVNMYFRLSQAQKLQSFEHSCRKECNRSAAVVSYTLSRMPDVKTKNMDSRAAAKKDDSERRPLAAAVSVLTRKH